MQVYMVKSRPNNCPYTPRELMAWMVYAIFAGACIVTQYTPMQPSLLLIPSLFSSFFIGYISQ